MMFRLSLPQILNMAIIDISYDDMIEQRPPSDEEDKDNLRLISCRLIICYCISSSNIVVSEESPVEWVNQHETSILPPSTMFRLPYTLQFSHTHTLQFSTWSLMDLGIYNYVSTYRLERES